MAAKEFAFVEVDINGRVTDKNHLHTIRKHIMKDIGKARRKPIFSTSQYIAKSNVTTLRDIRVNKTQEENDFIVPAPEAGFLGSGRMNPFQCYPVPVDMEILFLIDHLYNWPDPHLRPFKDTWFPISISDPAFFYEILSNISAHVFTLRNGLQNEDHCPQSIALHSRAMRSVRGRLLDPVLGISDGVIGTVLAFASFSHRTNDWAEYDLHMAALYRIIEARGGVSCLSNNAVLRHLISGVDLAGTCFLERPRPLFPLPTASVNESALKNMPWPVPQTSYHHQSIWKHAFRANSPLLSIFHDITTLIMTLKSDLMWKDSRPETVSIDQKTMGLLFGRLGELSVPVSDITEDGLLEECCRLAALLLLEKVSSQFNILDCRLHSTEHQDTTKNVQKLHTILITNMHYKQWILFKPLLNWIASLAAISTSSEEIKHDFLDLVVYAGKLMGLNGWDEALITAANMLWVGEFFDERYHSITKCVLWENSQ
jgi:hypothetical protein